MNIVAKPKNIFEREIAGTAKSLFLLTALFPARHTIRRQIRFSSPSPKPASYLPPVRMRERKEAAVDLGDASATIERYRDTLKRLLLMLVGMAEMGFGRPMSLVLGEAAVAPRPGRAGRTGRNKPSAALCLPRHLYRAILLLLRPAESAARRLVIAAAQGIVVTLPPFRPRKPKPRISDTVAAMRRLGLAVNLSKQDFARYEAERKAAELRATRPRGQNLS